MRGCCKFTPPAPPPSRMEKSRNCRRRNILGPPLAAHVSLLTLLLRINVILSISVLTNSKAVETALIGHNKVRRLTCDARGGPSMYILASTVATFFYSQWWLRYCKFAVPSSVSKILFAIFKREANIQFIQL